MCIPDSGLLLVDKPQGVTSHDIVACARHLLHTKRVGHAGTLDPMATGLLIIGFGNATRLLNYMLGHNKTYEAVIRLGESTTTDDADGEILQQNNLQLGPGVVAKSADDVFSKLLFESNSCNSELINQAFERIKQVIKENLTGKIMQAPTAFSAIKINGQRAYDLAREGKSVEIAPREIFVSDFSVSNPRITRGVSGKLVCDISAKVSCSSGTYIRALARDLGRLLGVGGHLTQLRRMSVGDFSVTDSRVLKLRAQMREFTDRNGVLQHRSKAVPGDDFDANNMLPKICLNMMDAASRSLPTLSIDENQAKDLRFGRWIELKSAINYENYPAIAYVPNANTAECDVVAVVELAKNIKSNQIKPIVVFPASEKTGKLDKYLK
ncbi:tRNA pseudouridine(55) synthase TruB [Gardnerella swidsinskii]|uniref:tRNA pseudouridine synthase B n=1 Tax=Gardnerella swidsinskii TaxID=2792979 RepID=UPI0001D858D2|nr:pseudouridine synthase [Gardnerella vaginalis 5-1]MDK6295609.1 tRNA pseudouridine(55) synthase TruB [Gardnerella swidsinskii]MDK7093190.1 tRNA pseudouridine(55) synthase TruB [Gardnerella swidsinskii]